VRLAEAVERFLREVGSISNSYEWYRRLAQKGGAVPIGRTEIRAWKERGAWSVDAREFEAAIAAHRKRRAHVAQVSRDLSRGVIHGRDGDVIETLDGGYEVRGAFRFVWSNQERARHRSYGNWYCNRCNRPAQMKHEKEECHLCADWSGCGRDCTLSEVACATCGARELI
jgi:hypothetical protein